MNAPIHCIWRGSRNITFPDGFHSLTTLVFNITIKALLVRMLQAIEFGEAAEILHFLMVSIL